MQSGSLDHEYFRPSLSTNSLEAVLSWCFRLRPIDDETSAVYVDHFHQPPELVSSSLTEFLATYEHNPEAAHGW